MSLDVAAASVQHGKAVPRQWFSCAQQLEVQNIFKPRWAGQRFRLYGVMAQSWSMGGSWVAGWHLACSMHQPISLCPDVAVTCTTTAGVDCTHGYSKCIERGNLSTGTGHLEINMCCSTQFPYSYHDTVQSRQNI